MSFWDKIRHRNIRLENVEPNKIFNVGLDDLNSIHDERSQDWVELAPYKIKPTIKNCRRAAKTPTVYGILNNLILKAISSFTIDGDDQKAVDHIIECDKEWNIKNMAYECLWKNFVDGECFYEYIVEDNHVNLRMLAFDGEKYLIRKLMDENGMIKGYMQWVIADSKVTNWKTKDYWEIMQNKEQKTISFTPDEISNPIFMEIDGVGVSLVRNVVDLAYEIESLNRMLPSIVYKSANVMVATIGNENRKETKIDKEARDNIAENLSDYHSKGIITVPYGISMDVVGDNVLPKVQEYIKVLKSQLYEGLITPESLYSSESSNRSTAQVQLTDSRTGHVLFIEYAQEFLKRWLERDLINKELELKGMEKDSVWIDFLTGEDNLDNLYLLKDNERNVGADYQKVNEDVTPTGNPSTALTREGDDYGS